MDVDQAYHWRKQLLWGLLLICIGGALLADQLGYVNVYDLWHYFPLILVLVGVIRMIGFPTAKEFVGGLWSVVIGLWLFANFEHMYGMYFDNSWPFLIIAWGVILILKPFIRMRFALNSSTNANTTTNANTNQGNRLP
jgi:hypothetical protein